MASISSFDVTTGVDFMEAHNAVDQATKEITQRYDFKGLKITIELNQKDKKIVLAAPTTSSSRPCGTCCRPRWCGARCRSRT